MSMSCCMCELWRLPRLFGDDTHAVNTRPRWARKHGIIFCVVPYVGGLLVWLPVWPIDKCSNKDGGRSERKTPTPCECEQAQGQTRQDKTRQEDKTRQDKTRQDKTRQDKTRQDKQDKTRQDKTRDKTRQDKTRQDK